MPSLEVSSLNTLTLISLSVVWVVLGMNRVPSIICLKKKIYSLKMSVG